MRDIGAFQSPTRSQRKFTSGQILSEYPVYVQREGGMGEEKRQDINGKEQQKRTCFLSRALRRLVSWSLYQCGPSLKPHQEPPRAGVSSEHSRPAAQLSRTGMLYCKCVQESAFGSSRVSIRSGVAGSYGDRMQSCLKKHHGKRAAAASFNICTGSA